MQVRLAEWAEGGHWRSECISLHWLCGGNIDLFESEREQGADKTERATGVTPALQTQQQPLTQAKPFPFKPVQQRVQTTCTPVRSSQPAQHPAMTFLVVEQSREVERMRGGCFPCRHGKVAASFTASDGNPGIEADMPVPDQVMHLPTIPAPPGPRPKPVSDDPKRPADLSATPEPAPSIRPSQSQPWPELLALQPQSPELVRPRIGSQFVARTQPPAQVPQRRAKSNATRPSASITSKPDQP